MKKNYFVLFVIMLSFQVNAQFVIKREIKEKIEGICNDQEVYSLFPIQDQVEAVCPVSNDVILSRLNEEVEFLKQNPKYKDKGMIGLIINCKGEVVDCKMDNNTKNTALDEQIEKVFNSLGTWKVGTLNGKPVDSSRLFSFKIKSGKFLFD